MAAELCRRPSARKNFEFLRKQERESIRALDSGSIPTPVFEKINRPTDPKYSWKRLPTIGELVPELERVKEELLLAEKINGRVNRAFRNCANAYLQGKEPDITDRVITFSPIHKNRFEAFLRERMVGRKSRLA